MRQADTKRAEVRARKKQRKQEEKAKLVAEVQRMKTLKRQEVEDRCSTTCTVRCHAGART